jgi:DNA polymerase-3 subunit delta
MKPREMLQNLGGSGPAPGYLFLGNEQFFRDRCRRALHKAVIGEENQPASPIEGVTEFNLNDRPLEELLDDARTLSLFGGPRLIVGRQAEGALPRGAGARTVPPSELVRYFADPTPGTTILLEASRYDASSRDDKSKLERVAKFYAGVPVRVDLERLSEREAVAGAQSIAKQLGLSVAPDVLAELTEMLGNDLARISNDLDKLSLYTGTGKSVTREDIELLVPEARQRGMFEFSDALARKDRGRALDILDILAQGGEYWPMQINLLAGLFRQALIVKEGGLKNPNQVSSAFQKRSMRIWPARARQVLGMARQFTIDEIESALLELFKADRDLRRERPDDRIIVEHLVVRLTA